MLDNNVLPRSTPEAQGLPTRALQALVTEAEATLHDLHSLMLLRHGQVVAEGWWAPYAREARHSLFSLSKSFTSTAIGLLVAEGRLSLDAPVLSFFPDEAPARVSRNLAAMQVRHLLSMSTGHAVDTTERMLRRRDGNWVREFFRCAVKYAPGTHFLYNTGATYMLSALLQRITGQPLVAYLQPRLFDPLGIAPPPWESSPCGVNTGGWGLSLATEDIARFGQLYLQRGRWRGRQVVPEAWVAAATARQVNNGADPESDWTQGYGYQFWRCRHNAYRGDGAFGQFCLVLPDHDVVLAITSGIQDMQSVLNVVWKHLLPALGAAPLPEDPAAQASLAETLAGLALPPVAGGAAGPGWEGPRRYALEANPLQLEAATFDFGAEADTVTFQQARQLHPLGLGHGAWRPGTTSLALEARLQPGAPVAAQAVAASGAWTSPDTYMLKAYVLNAPFCETLACVFAGEQVTLNLGVNVSFGPTAFPPLVGCLAPKGD